MSEPVGSRLTSGARLSPAAKWVFAIVGLLGANVAAMMILITKANEGPSRVVPAYSDNPGSVPRQGFPRVTGVRPSPGISKGHSTPSGVRSGIDRSLRYHGAADSAQRNPALGWTANAAIVEGVMTLIARDNSGAPLVGARVEVVGNYRSHGQRIVGELVEATPGEYTGYVGGTGWVDLSIAIEHSASRFVREIAVVAQ